tara:strand:- start:621 stop:797 length:177 start_codon:yes stop_codon:yes gene_type:complete
MNLGADKYQLTNSDLQNHNIEKLVLNARPSLLEEIQKRPGWLIILKFLLKKAYRDSIA